MSDPIDQLLSAYQPGPSRQVTYDEFQKVLDSTPLFMRETPDNVEGDYVLEALRSLVFEGEGDEVATNLKNHGNELYAQKSYPDAIKAYTDALEAKPSAALRVTLLNNRAACHLALKNYGKALKDAGTVIALGTKEGNVPDKALFRAAQALIALERWAEARDVVARGSQDKAWAALQREVDAGQKRALERVERVRKENATRALLAEAIKSRGVVVVNTPSPPDNPHPVHFSVADATILTPLVYPVFFLYPEYAQSDHITHFDETTSLGDHLEAMFAQPAPWDEKREYKPDNLVVYVETRHRRLLKCGKGLPLTEVLAKAVNKEGDGVVLKDGLLSFVVLPKSNTTWVEEFKRKRAA